jgi:hypothetical protein
MTNTITNGTATSWSASSPAREQFGIAPYGSQHGTGLSYGFTAMTVTHVTNAARQAVVLTDAAKVPRPRERKR